MSHDPCRCGLITIEPDGVCLKCKSVEYTKDHSLSSTPPPARLPQGLRRCGGCGKPFFKPGPPRHVYCSVACLPGKAPKKGPRPCKHCGQMFESSIRNKVYCTPACVTAAKRAYQALYQKKHADRVKAYKARYYKKREEPRLCRSCGKSFISGKGRGYVYCSAACSPWKKGPRPCKHCGQMFEPNASRRAYCSPACSTAGVRAYRVQWCRENPDRVKVYNARRYKKRVEGATCLTP